MPLPGDRAAWACLEAVADPRLQRSRRHKLVDILVLALCGFLAGCEGWVDVALFGRAKRKWLETFLELPNGIPSHDTFGRVFALLDPLQLAGVLRQFVQAVTGPWEGEAVAIDGKTLIGSGARTTAKQALHLVSAWATRQGVVLGQVATADHSNEITAIPRLLQRLDLRGATVTIDAMGCQKEIAQQVRAQGADYVLAVKGNQPGLEQALRFHLGRGHSRVPRAKLKTCEQSHGRQEQRTYTAMAARATGRMLRASCASVASAPTGTARRPKRCVTSSAACRRRWSVWLPASGGTGGSRTGCTGRWTLRSTRTTAGSARATRPRMPRCCAGWRCRF